MLRGLIKDSPETIKAEFQDLLQGIPITKVLNESIVFDDLINDETTIYSFLAFTGYLKAFDPHRDDNKIYYKLLVPNLEVKEIFETIITKWISGGYENKKLKQMFSALLRCDIESFEELLSDFVLRTLSYFDTAGGKDVERVYQAFILGLLVNLSGYEIYSNKESGLGRYDMSIIPKDKTKKAFIMELKKLQNNQTKDNALKKALKQIEDKKYEVEIKKRGINDIVKLGVVFDGKQAWVISRDNGSARCME